MDSLWFLGLWLYSLYLLDAFLIIFTLFIKKKKDSDGLLEGDHDLKNLKEQLNDDFPVGPLIRKCCTLDQVRFLCWTFMRYKILCHVVEQFSKPIIYNFWIGKSSHYIS